jgi:hypothetical protein
MEVGLACVHFDAPAVLAAIAAGGPAAEAVGHGFFGRLAQADYVVTQGVPRRPSWLPFLLCSFAPFIACVLTYLHVPR